MESKYLIMNIRDGHHSKFGKVVIIQANPMKYDGFVGYASETINNETQQFFVPDDDSILNSIISTARMRKPWTIDLDDYETEIVRNEETNRQMKIYVHKNLSGKTKLFGIEYTVKEVSFDSSSFENLEPEEKWNLSNSEIETPHGTFNIEGVIFVDEGPLVGLQFDVSGYLNVRSIDCYKGEEDNIFISTIAIVRQPNNVWLWAYFMDDEGHTLATFCGYDDLLNGLSRYVEQFRDLFS